MYTVTVQEVQEKLPEILEDVKRGVEVIIEQNNIAIAHLQPAPEAPSGDEKPRPRFGGAKHRLVYMADDFEAPIEDFAEYM